MYTLSINKKRMFIPEFAKNNSFDWEKNNMLSFIRRKAVADGGRVLRCGCGGGRREGSSACRGARLWLNRAK
jgi:hypothetical protein